MFGDGVDDGYEGSDDSDGDMDRRDGDDNGAESLGKKGKNCADDNWCSKGFCRDDD